MLLIIAHHYVVNSGVLDVMYENPLRAKSIFLFLFGAWGKTGINSFMMITGYYMCRSSIKFSKYLKLILEMLFYNLVIVLIFALTGYERSIKDTVKAFLLVRVIDSSHFFACFLMFYLFIPFLNILLKNIDKREHIRLIALLSFLYIFLGTVPKFGVVMNYVSWFSTLYVIAAYIRFYPPVDRRWGLWTLLFAALGVLSVLGCLKLGVILDKEVAYRFISDSNTFLAFAVAVSSFMFFKSLELGKSRVINLIGGSTFGVLCIHANSDTMRRWLWETVVDVKGHYLTLPFWSLLTYSIAVVAGVFVLCSIIDILRVRLFEKPVMAKITHSDSYRKWEEKFEAV